MNSQTAFANALLNAELPCPSGLKTWNGSDPGTRFAVYRNNVMVSLIDALADTYPVVQELVGEEFFRAMARVFA
ncbi:MAG: DNA-binding domain-containing protein, partial [Rhodoferax sp.]